MSKNSKPAGTAKAELPLRIISALVLIGISLLATTLGGPYFLALCVAGIALIYFEFSDIVADRSDLQLAGIGYGVILLFVLLWLFSSPAIAAAFGGGMILLLCAFQFFWKRQLWVGLGLTYAILPFIALVCLRGSGTDGLHAILLVFGCVWGADTFAYFVGRKVGGPKFAPAISPNKTWSGFLGGLAGSVLVTAIICLLLGHGFGIISVVLALLLGTLSSIGDLFESWIKRSFDRKDSGWIIPGHGGLLDRIDGLIFASVTAWIIGWFNGGVLLEPGSTGTGFLNAFILP